MLTIWTKFRDLYLEIKYEVLGVLLEFTLEKALECSNSMDAEEMKKLNEICRALSLEREKVFKKRLKLRGY